MDLDKGKTERLLLDLKDWILGNQAGHRPPHHVIAILICLYPQHLGQWLAIVST